MSPSDLDKDLINKTFESLDKGLKNSLGSYRDSQIETIAKLKQNLFRFSSAKSYQQLLEFNNLLYDNGNIKPWNDYKKEVLAKQANYNVNYLQAEYQTSKQSGQHARMWEEFQENAEFFPNLKYRTVGDDRVRDEHNSLNGVVKPLNDSFWNTYYPPNGFRCRCYVEQTDEEPTKGTPTTSIAPEFQNHVGKTHQVFTEDHPYFAIKKEHIKDYAVAFEKFKLSAPYYKMDGIPISVWADPYDLKDNLKSAKLLKKKLQLDVKIAPHLDGRIIKRKNPEYLIEGRKGERKAPEGLKLKNVFNKATKQEVEVLVLDYEKINLSLNEVFTELRRRLKNEKSYPSIKEVIYISKDGKLVKRWSRQDIKESNL